MKTIDARGLACPGPVLQTKAAIDQEHPDDIQVTVDNDAARQNISRFLKSQKFEASFIKQGNDIVITGRRSADSETQRDAVQQAVESKKNLNRTLVMITTDRIGHGDDSLGLKLMKSFISTLKEMTPDLWKLVFLNSGVKLTIDGSETLPALNTLEKEGVRILVCGTCLDHFNLLEKKAVGETTNMLDIVTSLQLTDKIITI